MEMTRNPISKQSIEHIDDIGETMKKKAFALINSTDYLLGSSWNKKGTRKNVSLFSLVSPHETKR